MSKVIFAKFSNDRAERFSICTDMVKTDSGKIEVRKYGAGEKAAPHIDDIVKWSELLTEQYEGSGIMISPTVKKEGYAVSDYIDGKTLEETVDTLIHNGNINEAENIVKKYLGIIKERNSSEEFVVTDTFKDIFGDVAFEGKMHSGKVNDIDMVLGNILVDGNGWHLIDYEWTFDFPVPVEFIMYRVLHYYFETNNSRKALKDVMSLEGVSEADIEQFRIMEVNFQNYVKGDKHPLRELYEDIGKPNIHVAEAVDMMSANMRIYMDRGDGYNEDDTCYRQVQMQGKNNYTISINVDKGVKKYRIDPCEESCSIVIKKVVGNGRLDLPYTTNGQPVEENVYAYDSDPWIEVNVEGTIIDEFAIELEMGYCAPEYMEVLKDNTERAQRAEAAIGALNGTIECQRQELDQLRAQVDLLNREKALMMTSRSWKMTKPVRKLKNGTKKLLKSNKVTYTVCKRAKCLIKGEKYVVIHPEVQSVKEIVSIMVPEKQYEEEKNTKFSKDITFSILVPLYNTPKRFLTEMIESVQYQTYGKWELCLADGSDDEHKEVGEICRKYAEEDKRIKYKKLEKNGGISENTNACIDMATGNYIALFDHDDFLHPSVLFENMKVICEKNADYVYTDECTFEGTNIFNIITRHCKPDYAIDNLRANNYICHFSVFKKTLLDKAGRFRSEYDGSQDHDLILRLTEKAENICHIPKILYYWRSHPNSVASDINAKTYAIDAAKRAVEAHMERAGLKAEVESSKAFPTIFKFKYELKETPKVSILIPNKDHLGDLKKCINSILEKSTYKDYEIIVIENNSIKTETFDYYKEIEKDDRIRVVHYEGEFNYSKINNFGESFASGKYILLLNNDTEVISEDWIEELLMYAQRDDVAVVGGKLFYEDDTIQHAGIVIGLGSDRAAGHVHYGCDKENVGYMGRLFFAQNMSAVTGACMMVKKSIYDDLGGLDEEFSVAFNDVDFCLKARQKGYLNIFTPYCEMYHYESKSRGFETTKSKKNRFKKEVKMFRTKWKDVIDAGDPYFNPNFSLDRPDFYIPG